MSDPVDHPRSAGSTTGQDGPVTDPPSTDLVADASVRPARPDDVEALADIQIRAWRTHYQQLLPSTSDNLLAPDVLASSWRAAVVSAPSARHRLLVATAGTRVVGFAAVAPSVDPDSSPDSDGELSVLVVDPEAADHGHGSRLLNAAADTLRDSGVRRIRTWVPEQDGARQEFLAAAGLRADGAVRVLDARDPDDPDASQELTSAEVASVREVRWSALLTDS
ncbi:MAG: GNAT family N-acetyltransferase [Angustibacter sp.]